MEPGPFDALLAKDELAPSGDDTGGRIGTIDGRTRVIGTQPDGVEPGPAPETPPTGTAGGGNVPALPPTTGPGAKPFEFGTTTQEDSPTRVIRVPYDALRRGEFQYNIVIRPYDSIVVPQPLTGEYYMGGHVGQPGVYSLTGRRINLMQAVVSAHMLDGVAVPERAYVVRRVHRGMTDQSLFVKVDLSQIFAGKQADVYLKPNDVVLVGTSVFMPFISAVRSSFRFTYGFGFLYDQNFGPQGSSGGGSGSSSGR